MVFNTFIDLCNHGHGQDNDQFHHTPLEVPCASLYSLSYLTSPLTSVNHWFILHLYSFIFLRMSYKQSHTIKVFQDWFISLSVVPLRFIWVVASITMYYWVAFRCMHVSQFSHSPIEGHQGYWWVLTIINKAAINIPEQVFGVDISFYFASLRYWIMLLTCIPGFPWQSSG